MLNEQRAPQHIARRGLLLVLSSPSGAGKSTLSRLLLQHDADVRMSVSVTTRPMREGEVDGVDYHFIDRTAFGQMQRDGQLLEFAEVFDNGYGTPRQPVEDWLNEGKDVLFDIDWQGTQQIHEKMREDLVRVFILPPSADELRKRLIGRAQDSAVVVAKRMAEAANEISHWAEYDYVLVNDHVEDCQRELMSILEAERLRRPRRAGLEAFVRRLRDKL